ncbi:proton-dependent oligopeptide transporter, POT family [Maridesulfovibrio ferrireducens]|uniref:Proton-dependent oligopeptide transporter, POT family n=1 Tax=Maridesulfovibrio ferrireducens TaxID=246191 RepID=A0A1G9J088_9BACT|nr:oligopeptide:H+ symporter [Maridesulfovibrio ferrireducens]SDL30889.1 proton-dependent oligopeptide transporter, POT family [Maridesulfovibrio ferrireducens]
MSESSVSPFKHPKPFYLLFSVEMWERFGYYGMQALLVLFMVTKLGFSDDLADTTFSAFAALVYAFICLGGYVGDKILGNRRTMFFGAVVLAVGYGLLGIDCDRFLYPALGIIIAGNGLFKANPSALVSKLYEKGDSRVDGAFTLYYMAINIGSFAAMSLCPVIQKMYGWNAGFLVCFIGMGIAIGNYIIFRSILDPIGSEADFKPLSVRNLGLTLLGTIFVAFISALLLKHLVVAHELLYVAVLVVAGLFIREIYRAEPHERSNLIICLILMVEAVVFFALYQQMPTSLNLFAARNVHLSIFGIPVQAASFQALNPFWIMVISPFLAMLYTKLDKSGKDLSLPGKFALGMIMCCASFLTLALVARYRADAAGYVSGNWLVLSYCFQSIGELLVSGLGLAMVSRLTPERSMGFMMGAWFMFQSVAMVLGGYIATLASVPNGGIHATKSLVIYGDLFMRIGLVTGAIALVMTLFVPVLKKYIRE